MKNLFRKIKDSRGFTLLYASLIGALLLAIASGIFSIIFKELVLTSSSRESFFAFYSADSGLECALYWDLNERLFATSSQSVPDTTGVSCNEIPFASNWSITSDANSAITVFELSYPPEEYCATVTVTKSDNDTLIESRGYNTCNTSNPRRVERGIKAQY